MSATPKPQAVRGRPKTLADDDRRALLLTAAMTVFIEKGFARATTTDIATRAGMSKRDL
uniref:TetR/AcrR family transcriptional regulator n=1 Tax=Martelella sp. HB161492 TaxID=2720726 RepID=UPI00158FC195